MSSALLREQEELGDERRVAKEARWGSLVQQAQRLGEPEQNAEDKSEASRFLKDLDGAILRGSAQGRRAS